MLKTVTVYNYYSKKNSDKDYTNRYRKTQLFYDTLKECEHYRWSLVQVASQSNKIFDFAQIIPV